jgi:hypothetical protein
VRRAGVLCVLSFSCIAVATGLCPARSVEAGQASGAPAAAVVRVGMKNVEFHLTDRIIVHIAALNGKLTAKPGEIPVFDNKESFMIDADSANITVSMTALTNDLNDYVFVKPSAPLKKLNVTTRGKELVVKGLLVSKGGVPFQTAGTLSVTPEGLIRVHITKVKALKLPVKGLMDLLGVETADVLSTKKVEGVTVDKDDLIVDPAKIHPPPELKGHLVSVDVENQAIVLVFRSPEQTGSQTDVPSSCGGRNYLAFKGGSVHFGKLTMSDTDLELIDSDPADPFDFAIDHYNDQLVAGYSKMTRKGGLCVHMPDYNKIKQTSNPKQ